MLDSAAATVKVAPDVTDRPGGRAGERELAEGSGFQSRAAPATVTGELRPNTPLGDTGKAGRGGDPGARKPGRDGRSAPGGVHRKPAEWRVRIPGPRFLPP